MQSITKLSIFAIFTKKEILLYKYYVVALRIENFPYIPAGKGAPRIQISTWIMGLNKLNIGPR